MRQPPVREDQATTRDADIRGGVRRAPQLVKPSRGADLDVVVQEEDVALRVGRGDPGVVPASEAEIPGKGDDSHPVVALQPCGRLVGRSVVHGDDRDLRKVRVLKECREAPLGQRPVVPAENDDRDGTWHRRQSRSGGAVRAQRLRRSGSTSEASGIQPSAAMSESAVRETAGAGRRVPLEEVEVLPRQRRGKGDEASLETPARRLERLGTGFPVGRAPWLFHRHQRRPKGRERPGGASIPTTRGDSGRRRDAR